MCQELLNSWPQGTWGNHHGRSHSSALSVTRASQHQVTWKPMRGSTQERFKCTKCDKCFSRSRSLKEHERGPTQKRRLLHVQFVTRVSQELVTLRNVREPTRKRSHSSAKLWQEFLNIKLLDNLLRGLTQERSQSAKSELHKVRQSFFKTKSSLTEHEMIGHTQERSLSNA